MILGSFCECSVHCYILFVSVIYCDCVKLSIFLVGKVKFMWMLVKPSSHLGYSLGRGAQILFSGCRIAAFMSWFSTTFPIIVVEVLIL